MTTDAPDGTAAIVDPAVVDLDRLQTWMTSAGLGTGALWELTLLGGGTQNILLRFRRGEREYVLRRPPEHKRANSDETMLREARVLSALASTDVPHPRFIASCEHLDVLGAAFYLMEPVDGLNPTVEIPGHIASQPHRQYELGLAIVDALAALSRVDPFAVGLADLGKPHGWLDRQVPRWQRQLDGYVRLDGYHGNELPHVDEVGRWLAAHQPQPPGWRAGLIHGDFHMANVLIRRDAPALAAVVDWELATLGDPLLDFGQLLATWPGNANSVHIDPAVPLPGLPTEDELIARYARRGDRGLHHLTWFRTLACYRLAILVEGTYARALAGKADMETGRLSHQRAIALLEQAMTLIE